MLAHSTNPRGGVVHAMSLSDALIELGIESVLHAPDASGRGFFRKTRGAEIAFAVEPPAAALRDMIQQRIHDYVEWFEVAAHRNFDVYHAHDGISANALLRLKQRGVISGYARTVHHVDQFSDPPVARWERDSIEAADALFVVSEYWREKLSADFDRDVLVVGNGVDLDRFDPRPDGRDAHLRARLGLESGPVFLCLGGVEARKNTLSLLRAFEDILGDLPFAQLVVAGGATLLDHGAYRNEFDAALGEMGRRARQVHVIGQVADADIPALYRLADVIAAPSLNEGFGLAVIEALACERPVVVSRTEPFIGYLKSHEAHWCNPRSPKSIAIAMRSALAAPCGGLRAIAARFSWDAVARRHLPVYQTLGAFADA